MAADAVSSALCDTYRRSLLASGTARCSLLTALGGSHWNHPAYLHVGKPDAVSAGGGGTPGTGAGGIRERKGKGRAFSDVAQGCCWVSQVGAAFMSEPGLGGIQCENQVVSKWRWVETWGRDPSCLWKEG